MAKDMYQKRKKRQNKNEEVGSNKTNINCLISIYGNMLINPYKIKKN